MRLSGIDKVPKMAGSAGAEARWALRVHRELRMRYDKNLGKYGWMRGRHAEEWACVLRVGSLISRAVLRRGKVTAPRKRFVARKSLEDDYYGVTEWGRNIYILLPPIALPSHGQRR